MLKRATLSVSLQSSRDFCYINDNAVTREHGMSLTPTQESALISELVEVIERFHASIDDCPESYEARVTQPSPEHLIIKLQPASMAEE